MKNPLPVLGAPAWGRCGRCCRKLGALRVKATKFDGTVCYMCVECVEHNRAFPAFL